MNRDISPVSGRSTYTFDKWLVWLFLASWFCLIVGAIGQWLT